MKNLFVKSVVALSLVLYMSKAVCVEPHFLPLRVPEKKVVPKYVSRELPQGRSGRFKTFMDYRTITNKRSAQWKMQQEATTDEEGFRLHNKRYMIAVGSHYAKKVGVEYRITLDSELVIYAVVADIKQDRFMDRTNRYNQETGNIVEFLVDVEVLDAFTRRTGDVSYSGLPGGIVKMEEVIK